MVQIKKPVRSGKIYIGVDSSTKTGLAFITMEGNVPKLLRTMIVTIESIVGFARSQWLAAKVKDEIAEMIGRGYSPGPVFIEGYSFASEFQLPTLVEIGTLTRLVLLEDGHELYIASPMTLKKFATDEGKGKKAAVVLGAYKRWGFSLTDDNRCDAAVLAVMAAAQDGAYVPPTKPMKEALNGVVLCA